MWTPEETQLFDLSIDEVITISAKRWEENRKSRNETVGEDRAEQELAFRDKLVSVKSEKVGKSGKEYLWITVNPRQDVLVSDLVASVHKMYSKAWIQGTAYIFEVSEGGHAHSHGLIKAKYEYKRAVKELGNSVKKICDISNSHCFKVVALDEEVAREKLAYMLGQKQDSKLKGVELSSAWREENKLENLYSRGAPILLAPREELPDESFTDLPVDTDISA